MKNTKIIVITLIVMVTVLAMFFYWKKSNSVSLQPDATKKISAENKNETKAITDLNDKLSVVRGTVISVETGKLVVKTEEGQKEIIFSEKTPVYQVVNKDISPSDSSQIKKGVKINIQYWNETLEANSILIEE